MELIRKSDALHAVLHNTGDAAVAAVQEIKAVDAVPVVRCGECMYDGRCMFQSFVIDNSRDEVPYDKNTFYCADGERKDGEHDV